MSAQPLPRPTRGAAPSGGRKPVTSSDSADTQKGKSGYFKYPHALVDLIPFVISGQSAACEYWLLTKVLSLVNQRDHEMATKQRKQTGGTGLLTTPDLFRQARWETRMGQEVIGNLTLRDEDEGLLPALLKIPAKEALEQGYITPLEAREAKRGAYVLVPCVDHWQAIAERNRQLEAEAAREERADRKKSKPRAIEPEPEPAESTPAPETQKPAPALKLIPKPYIFRENPHLQLKLATSRTIGEIDHLHDGEAIEGDYSFDGPKLLIRTTSKTQSIALSNGICVDYKGSGDVASRKPVNGVAAHEQTTAPRASAKGHNGSTQSIASKSGNGVDSKGPSWNGSRNGSNHTDEVPAQDLSALQEMIDTKLRGPVGKNIDLPMLNNVAEQIGGLSIDLIALFGRMIDEELPKIWSHGYLLELARRARARHASETRSGKNGHAGTGQTPAEINAAAHERVARKIRLRNG